MKKTESKEILEIIFEYNQESIDKIDKWNLYYDGGNSKLEFYIKNNKYKQSYYLLNKYNYNTYFENVKEYFISEFEKLILSHPTICIFHIVESDFRAKINRMSFYELCGCIGETEKYYILSGKFDEK